MVKVLSRPKRWDDAVVKALEALEELVDIQSEYQEWYDAMPDNLQASATGDMLEQITDLDLDGAQSTLEEAEGVDLPRGFGRD